MFGWIAATFVGKVVGDVIEDTIKPKPLITPPNQEGYEWVYQGGHWMAYPGRRQFDFGPDSATDAECGKIDSAPDSVRILRNSESPGDMPMSV